jgi:predicted acetyltransferase
VNDSYGAPREDELGQIASILSWSFCFPLADAEPWMRRGGLENVRVVRRDGAVAATLLMIPHAQFFGGKSVPAIGIAGVGAAAEARGTGAAIRLMEETLREVDARGVATSNLYPATLSLYRRVGYELAGTRNEVTVPLASIAIRDRTLPLRPMTSADDAAVEACYRAYAARMNGHLDRGPYVWDRVRNPRGENARGFVVSEAGRVDGYVFLYEKRMANAQLYSLFATDLVASTPAAARRLLTLFADHGTLADTVTWSGSTNDSLIHLLPSLGFTSRLHRHWMIRLVDVQAALTARGYPAWARGEIEIEIADELLTKNAGRFVLHVSDGRGEVARGGRGGLRMHVRALAAMMSGHMTPHALAAAGHVEGTDEALTRAAAIFGASGAWMPDFF